MPFWVNAPIQRHADYVAVLHVVVEGALHETVRAQAVLDVALQCCQSEITYPQPVLSVQLNWPEIFDVFRIEEHPPDRCLRLVHLQWVARQNNSFQDDLQWVRHENCP